MYLRQRLSLQDFSSISWTSSSLLSIETIWQVMTMSMKDEYGVHSEQQFQYLLSNGFVKFFLKKMASLYKD